MSRNLVSECTHVTYEVLTQSIANVEVFNNFADLIMVSNTFKNGQLPHSIRLGKSGSRLRVVVFVISQDLDSVMFFVVRAEVETEYVSVLPRAEFAIVAIFS